jgi:hypothetical protein
MPSPAAQKFHALAVRAEHVQSVASDKRLRPLTRPQTESLYHAALAGYVAAWEAYVEQLVRDFYGVIFDTTPKFQAIHAIAEACASEKIKKFNTPNPQNSRFLLVQNTGYDPYSDWIWPTRSMGAIQVQDRFGEILHVRHSFAHGFTCPLYSWNTLPSGGCRLTRNSLEMVAAFFRNLVIRTDKGMRQHIQTVYGIPAPW